MYLVTLGSGESKVSLWVAYKGQARKIAQIAKDSDVTCAAVQTSLPKEVDLLAPVEPKKKATPKPQPVKP